VGRTVPQDRPDGPSTGGPRAVILQGSVKLVLLAAAVLLVLGAPSGSGAAHARPACTSGASSIGPSGDAQTTWYPPGCVRPQL